MVGRVAHYVLELVAFSIGCSQKVSTRTDMQGGSQKEKEVVQRDNRGNRVSSTIEGAGRLMQRNGLGTVRNLDLRLYHLLHLLHVPDQITLVERECKQHHHHQTQDIAKSTETKRHRAERRLHRRQRRGEHREGETHETERQQDRERQGAGGRGKRKKQQMISDHRKIRRSWHTQKSVQVRIQYTPADCVAAPACIYSPRQRIILRQIRGDILL
jgi:hypothetical protein